MLKRRDFICLIGSAAVAKWPLAALNQWYLDGKTVGLPKITQSRLFVKLTALDRADGIAELTRLEHKRIDAAQREHLLDRPPAYDVIAITAEKIGLTRNLVRRSLVISGLSETGKAEAKHLGLGNSQTALYAAAKVEGPSNQVEKLRLIARGRAPTERTHATFPYPKDANEALSLRRGLVLGENET